jgi:hypothetical protein
VDRGIPDDELAFREEALCWLVSRHVRAVQALKGRQFEAFRDFVDLWLDAFDWRTDADVSRYLQLQQEQRRERLERFRRQAESWDVTLEFPVGDEASRGEERARWRRDYDRVKKRLKRQADAAGWESVREAIEAEHRLRAMPAALRESFEFLGLGPRATLADARRCYRDLAKRYHPDKSGTARDMVRLNAAWQRVEAFFTGQ